MADEETTETTTETTTTEPSTVTASELEDIIGRVVDSRLEALDLSKLDKLDVLDSLSGSIDEAFARNKSAGGTTDNKGLLRDIEAMVDRKLSGIGGGSVGSGRKPGWLGRYLTGSSSGD